MAGTAPCRMHRFRKRSAAAVPHTVMARLVRAIYSSTCAATDGPDKPGHDDVGTSWTISQTPDFAVISEMCASRRAGGCHDTHQAVRHLPDAGDPPVIAARMAATIDAGHAQTPQSRRLPALSVGWQVPPVQFPPTGRPRSTRPRHLKMHDWLFGFCNNHLG